MKSLGQLANEAYSAGASSVAGRSDGGANNTMLIELIMPFVLTFTGWLLFVGFVFAYRESD